jgi:hypothetical protein
MTVCVAALCEERKAPVVAVGRMVRSNRCATEAEFHKISRLPKVLVADAGRSIARNE